MELEKERVGRKQSAEEGGQRRRGGRTEEGGQRRTEEGGHKKTGADVNWEDKNVVRGRSQDGGSQWNLEKTETRQRREIADKLVTYEELFGMQKQQ